jgi:hypothetical protein
MSNDEPLDRAAKNHSADNSNLSKINRRAMLWRRVYERFHGPEFWRFVQVQQTVAAAAQSFIEYPPDAAGRFVQPR